MKFFDELKRRRVFRVLGAYLVAAWVAIQAADLLLPRLGAPDWTVTAVIVLSIVGLFVALGLAWAFDITGDGVVRTPDISADGSTTGSTTRAGAPAFRAGRAAFFVLGILVACSFGWFMVKRSNDVAEKKLDTSLIAVLPFRVSADPALAYLREGMIDLLAATIVSDDGTRTVDPPSLLAEWRTAVGAPGQDLSADSARAVARRLGAGTVIIGGVVGNERRVTINVDVISVTTGDVIARARVDGAMDSLPRLIDRLAGEVLGYNAGESKERVSLLANVPLPAISEYVAGRARLRGGYYTEAMQHFTRAMYLDSTFVLPAFGLIAVHGWIEVPVEQIARARTLAWGSRDRLAPVERALLLASVGPAGNEGASSGGDMLAAARNAVALAPDRGEAHNWLGEWLYHVGDAAGVENARAQAIAAYDRVLEMDPNVIGAMEHRAELALMDGDTTTFLRLVDRAFAHDSAGVPAHMVAIRAAMRNDRATFDRLKQKTPKDTEYYNGFFYHTQASLRLLDYTDELVDGFVRDEPFGGWIAFAYLNNRGRPSAAREALAAFQKGGPDFRAFGDVGYVMSALFDDTDIADADKALAALREFIATDKLVPVRAVHVDARCAIALWEQSRNPTADVSAQAAALRAIKGTRKATEKAQICAYWLDAQSAVARNAPDAGRKLEQLDSIARTVPAAMRNSNVGIADINPAIARMLVARGETARAIETLDRVIVYWGSAHDHLAANTLVQARLAAGDGKRADAIQYYRRYLTLMSDPEPSMRGKVTIAQAELQKLTGKQ